MICILGRYIRKLYTWIKLPQTQCKYDLLANRGILKTNVGQEKATRQKPDEESIRQEPVLPGVDMVVLDEDYYHERDKAKDHP